ncbi:MAG: hypothetical protein JJ911_18305 [Rhizobiaceae bacterium]|nr:hypothetical protein [Rhizobiaceae bacterium]
MTENRLRPSVERESELAKVFAERTSYSRAIPLTELIEQAQKIGSASRESLRALKVRILDYGARHGFNIDEEA